MGVGPRSRFRRCSQAVAEPDGRPPRRGCGSRRAVVLPTGRRHGPALRQQYGCGPGRGGRRRDRRSAGECGDRRPRGAAGRSVAASSSRGCRRGRTKSGHGRLLGGKSGSVGGAPGRALSETMPGGHDSVKEPNMLFFRLRLSRQAAVMGELTVPGAAGGPGRPPRGEAGGTRWRFGWRYGTAVGVEHCGALELGRAARRRGVGRRELDDTGTHASRPNTPCSPAAAKPPTTARNSTASSSVSTPPRPDRHVQRTRVGRAPAHRPAPARTAAGAARARTLPGTPCRRPSPPRRITEVARAVRIPAGPDAVEAVAAQPRRRRSERPRGRWARRPCMAKKDDFRSDSDC